MYLKMDTCTRRVNLDINIRYVDKDKNYITKIFSVKDSKPCSTFQRIYPTTCVDALKESKINKRQIINIVMDNTSDIISVGKIK